MIVFEKSLRRATDIHVSLLKRKRTNDFVVKIVKLWNELPGDIVEADSFQLFKSKLKLYLIAMILFYL